MGKYKLLCDTCIYCQKEQTEFNYPWYWNAPIHKGTKLLYFCKKMNKYIRKFRTQCKDYQNTRLDVVEFMDEMERREILDDDTY